MPTAEFEPKIPLGFFSQAEKPSGFLVLQQICVSRRFRILARAQTLDVGIAQYSLLYRPHDLHN